jgi:hypothetical protein
MAEMYQGKGMLFVFKVTPGYNLGNPIPVFNASEGCLITNVSSGQYNLLFGSFNVSS